LSGAESCREQAVLSEALTAGFRYFAMLSGQGWTAVAGCRQFFYARYIDWMITFPLITILLGFIAGSEWSVILGAIGAQGACASAAELAVI